MAASEAHLLARLLADGLDHHDAVTDGRSYGSKDRARSRQRAFLRALRIASLDDIHTHVRCASDGRWRVYATRVAVYPAPPVDFAGSSHRSPRRAQAASTASG
jgi:hypothetical protein